MRGEEEIGKADEEALEVALCGVGRLAASALLGGGGADIIY